MSNTVAPSLGTLLKVWRKGQGLTLRQLQNATGISNAYLSMLENDLIKRPSATVLYKLAALYGMTLDALLEASGQMVMRTPPSVEVVQGLGPMSITQEELGQLIQYLRFIRWQKNQPSIEINTTNGQ